MQKIRKLLPAVPQKNFGQVDKPTNKCTGPPFRRLVGLVKVRMVIIVKSQKLNMFSRSRKRKKPVEKKPQPCPLPMHG